MIFQIPVRKRPVLLEFLLYLPLVLFLSLFCVKSSQSLLRLKSADDLYTSLFSGSSLSSDEVSFLSHLTPQDIETVMTPWSESRRKAAFLLMEYNGYRGPAAGADGQPQAALSERSGFFAEVSSLMESESYEEAELLLRNTLDSGDESVMDDDFFLLLRSVVMKTDSWKFWGDALTPERDDAGYGLSFFLAACHEKQNHWSDALLWYEKAASSSRDWEELRRSQWYILRLMTRQFPELLAGFFESSGVLRNDGDYFDDVMDEFYSLLIRQRRWTELAALLPLVRSAGLTESASQGLFLLEKGREEGFVTFSEPLIESSGFNPDPMGYFALRSRPESWPRGSGSTDSAALPGPDNMDEVYQILIGAGYQAEVYRLWDKNRETLTPETVKSLCLYLEDKGDLYELIRFAGFWFHIFPADQALELLPWVFPGSDRYTFSDKTVPQELILGIIRRESAFHETIFSFAGAGGLMQLMPSTAEELARKNRLESWNLLEAEDNILLGTLYLEWLRERPWTSSYVDVLAAYNGGGGNLRSWKRRLGYEDPDLFIQSIPFRETRDYVRKVIVAAASYRYLDTGVPPGDWVEQFYRSF